VFTIINWLERSAISEDAANSGFKPLNKAKHIHAGFLIIL